jgi:hypothetical protein
MHIFNAFKRWQLKNGVNEYKGEKDKKRDTVNDNTKETDFTLPTQL